MRPKFQTGSPNGCLKLDSKANLLVNKQQNSLLILQFLSGEKCRFLKTENSVLLFQNSCSLFESRVFFRFCLVMQRSLALCDGQNRLLGILRF